MAKPLLKWSGVAALVILAVFLYQRGHRNTQSTSESKEASSEVSAKAQKGQKGKRGFQGPIPVRVVAAQRGDMDQIVEALGTVTPLSTVTVRSRVDGTLLLQRVSFREGQMVKAGEVLAQIDPVPLQIQVHQAEGVVQKDQALLNNAKADLSRYQNLAQQESGSKQQRDTQASLVEQLEGTLKVDRALLDTARLQLSYARITAPINGRIGLRQLDPGNFIKSGDAGTLAVITQLSPITVVFSIPQDRLSQVLHAMQAGKSLTVTAYDRDALTLRATGTLVAIDNQMDASTGTVKLKARFENADNALFPSQFVNVGLQVEHLKNVVIVPTSVIQQGTPGSFVYVVNTNHIASVRPITVGLTQGNRVMVTKGLEAGESIVMEGVDNLRDGAKVNVIVPSTAGAESAKKAQSNGQHGGHHHKSDE